jgi:transketolase
VIPKDVYAAWDAKAAGRRRGRLERKLRRLQGRLPRAGRRVDPPHEGRAAEALRPDRRGRRGGRAQQGRDRGQRKASQIALEAFTAGLPELLGGSADLTGSNLTNTKSTPALRVDGGRGGVADDGNAHRWRAATSTTACANSAWPPS